MSEANFTNGEWQVNFLDSGCEAEIFTNCNSNGDIWYICTIYDAADNASLRDNAHLIAAAPEMYEMLDRYSKHLKKAGYDTDDIEQLLAKARGEQ